MGDAINNTPNESAYSSTVRKVHMPLGNPTHAREVTTSDATVFIEPSIIRIGTAGDVKVTHFGDEDVNAIIITTLVDGEIYPFPVKKVWSTGTTGADIVRYY